MSLRTTQQIDKLLVGQIFPRDSNQNFISTGQILLTDNQGRANWTSLSSIGGNYAQFTSLSTNEGVIVADQPQTTLNFREGAGINLQIISNALYLNTTAFTAIDIDGGNSLLSSNISNNVVNPRLRFVNGNYTKIRGDPGTNSIFIDVDFLSTTRGARAAYTSLIIQNNSSYAQPPASESVIIDAIVSDASLTLIGIDDLKITNANFSPSCNVVFIGLSTITAAKFSTLYTSAFDGLSNLSVSIDVLNSRQINTQGVSCNQFFPVSTQVWRTSTTFSAFYNFTFNPLRDAVTAAVNDTAANYSTLSSYVHLNNIYATGISNALTTVSNTGITTSNNLTTVSNTGISNSTFIDSAYSTLSSYIRQNVGIFSLSSLTLSTLLVSSIINVSTISTTGNLNVGGQTNLNRTFVTGGLTADTVTSVFFGDGSHLTGISGGGGGVQYSEFYPISTTAIQASTLTTIFYSTLSSYIKSINTGGGISIVPPILSTTFLSTGFLSASNISAITMSTNYGFFSTISAGTIYGRFAGDASLLTSIPNNGAVLTVSNNVNTVSNLLDSVSTNVTTVSTSLNSLSNNVITVSNLLNSVSTNVTTVSTNLNTVSNSVNYLLTVSNTSAITTSTTYGFFSTISAGIIYGRFIGDGSGLTGVASGGISIVPPVLSTTFLSTGFLSASNISAITMSTNYGFFSTISAGTIYGRFAGDASLLTSIPNNGAVLTVSNNVITVSNLLDSVSTNVTTVSTNLNSLSNNATTVSNLLNSVSTNLNTVSNSVNYLLTVSNTSAITTSTSYGFFSTISAGIIYGRFIGDGSGLTGVASGGISIVPPVLSTTFLSTGFLSARNISAITMSTNYGFFSTISAGTIYAKFVGDGSGLTGIASGGVSIIPPVLSTTLLSTGILTASNISTVVISTNAGFASSFFINRLTTSTITALLGSFSSISVGQAYISSLTVDSLFIGNDIGFTNMGDVIATSLSTIQVTTANLIAVNISAAFVSTNYGFFSTISAGTIYAKFVGDGSGLTGIATGGLIVPPVLSTTFMSTGFLSARNISSLTMSTNYGFFSTISAGTIYGRFAGDASLLTAIPNTGAVLAVSNNVITVSNLLNSVSTNVTNVSTNLNTVSNSLATNTTNITTVSNSVNYLLTVSNYSAITMSTSYGFFSTISAGTIYGRFAGDASLLTAIPNTGAVLAVSNNVITVSNLLNSVSTNVTNVSTNLNVVSNLINSVSTSVTNVSTNLNTVSNTVATNANNITTISNRVNYLLTVSNYSAITMSTSYGFFSTISAGVIYGRFVGDGSGLTGIATGGLIVPPVLSTTFMSTGFLSASNISAITMSTNYGFFSTISAGTIYGRFAGDASLLTAIPNTGAVLTVSNNVTTVSNLLNSVSTSVTNVSTNLNTVSNTVATNANNITTISNRVNYLLTVSNYSAITMSTSYGFFSTISAGTIYGKFAGDASLLTAIPNTGAVLAVSNNVITVSNLLNSVSTNITTVSTNLNTVSNLLNAVSTIVITVSTNLNTLSNNLTTVSNSINYLLTVSNTSAITTSTSFGFFSSISAGTIYGRFIGDGSLLTAIPNTGAVLTVSNNVTTVSNLLNSVSTNITTVSTNLNTVSNLLNSVSTSVITVSTNLNTVSNTVATNTTNITTISNRVNYLLTVSNTSAITTSTSYGFFSTISAGNVYGKFIGDGSQLTGITGTGSFAVPPILSTTTLSTGILTARSISTTSISTNIGFASSFVVNNLTTSTTFGLLGIFSTISTTQLVVSSLTVNSLMIGGTLGYVNMGDIVTTSLSTLIINTGFINAQVISSVLLSTTFGFFSTISAGTIYGRFVGDGSRLTGIASGGLSIVPPVLSTTFLSTGFLSASNISAITMSTNYGFFSTISAGTIYGRFAGDGSLLTAIPNTGAVLTVSNNVTTVSNSLTTVSNSVNYLLTVSNYSAITMSTSFGFFSTLSSGLIYGRFVGDGSLLTAIPNTGAVLTVSNNVTTVSNSITTVSNSVNYLLTVSNYSAITMSTSFGFFSTLSSGLIYGRFAGDGSLLTAIPNTGAVLAVSNLLNSVSTNVTNISTNLNTVSNTVATNATNITTISNRVNYLLTVSNYSAITMSTSFGFFSTLSSGLIYGRFVGDGSGLTGLASGGISIIPPVLSTTFLSTGFLSASNISAITMSTNYGFFSTISAGSIYGRFVGDASLLTAIPNTGAVLSVSNNLTTVSNSVNYLLTVSNYSAITLSTSFGFFSTLSSGSIYGRFIGDASLLTAIPNTGAVLTVSNNVTTVSNSLTAVSNNLTTVSNSVNYLLTVSNYSAITTSTSFGFFSTLSSGSIYGRFIGDASLLTAIPNTGAVLAVSNNLTTVSNSLTAVSNSVNYLLTVSNYSAITMSTSFGFFSTLSSGSIYGRFIGDGSLLTSLRFSYSSPPVLSTTFLSTGFLSASNISAISMSTNYGFFSTISAGTIYAKFVGDGSGLTGIASGGVSIIPPILSTTLLSTGILTASNISTAVISTNAGFASSFFIDRLTTSTVSALLGSFSTLSVSQVYISSLTVDNLTIGNDNGFINMGDVIATSLSTGTITAANIIALNISTTRISTSHGFFSTISAGTVYGRFVGDGSGLTGITGSGGMSIVPPVLSTTFLSTGFLSASNISAITMSTNYGFFSTISTGSVYGRHIGDGSGLTNLPTSSLSLSSGNISISTITLIDTVNNSTGTIYERSSLLYFNTFVIGGSYVWTSQLLTGN